MAPNYLTFRPRHRVCLLEAVGVVSLFYFLSRHVNQINKTYPKFKTRRVNSSDRYQNKRQDMIYQVNAMQWADDGIR